MGQDFPILKRPTNSFPVDSEDFVQLLRHCGVFPFEMKTHHLLPVLAALAILPCSAQSTNTPPPRKGHGPEARQNRIDRREANLEKRIDQGVAKGKLTSEQASNLEGKLDQIKQGEAQALQNDGKITRKEGRELNHEANKLSHEIHQEKHPGKARK